jgi:predicted RNA polymerase sigma factor
VRRSYGKLVAFLAAVMRDVAVAEDALSSREAGKLQASSRFDDLRRLIGPPKLAD